MISRTRCCGAPRRRGRRSLPADAAIVSALCAPRRGCRLAAHPAGLRRRSSSEALVSRSLRGFLGFATLLLLGLSASPAQAQLGAGDYAARRAALTTQIDSGVVLAFGAPETVSHWPSF